MQDRYLKVERKTIQNRILDRAFALGFLGLPIFSYFLLPIIYPSVSNGDQGSIVQWGLVGLLLFVQFDRDRLRDLEFTLRIDHHYKMKKLRKELGVKKKE
jgi:hypothetical protein